MSDAKLLEVQLFLTAREIYLMDRTALKMIDIIRKDEREECAKLCETLGGKVSYPDASDFATAIRARGES